MTLQFMYPKMSKDSEWPHLTDSSSRIRVQRSPVAPQMPTDEREFPAGIPDALSFSLLISLEHAVHLRFPSSAAVSWFKQLPRPTLEAAASRGCLGSAGLLTPTPVPLPDAGPAARA